MCIFVLVSVYKIHFRRYEQYTVALVFLNWMQVFSKSQFILSSVLLILTVTRRCYWRIWIRVYPSADVIANFTIHSVFEYLYYKYISNRNLRSRYIYHNIFIKFQTLIIKKIYMTHCWMRNPSVQIENDRPRKKWE